jgi:predicted RNA-binding Zn ribbon-like protein
VPTVTDFDLPVLGGALCLDFVNTVDPRLKEPRHEFLDGYDALVEWGAFIGVLQPAEAASLTAAARDRPDEAAAVHARAIELREALYELFSPPRKRVGGALDTLNAEYRVAAAHAQLDATGGRFRPGWTDRDALDRVLWPVAQSAWALLSSDELARVGECRGEGCGWLFLDTSKSHRRRWCSMAICGNREKARRHRERARR